MARIFKSSTRISSTSMVFSLTTNTLAQILISPVHSNVKTTSCVQKLVIRILCASLAYKERVIRIHSSILGSFYFQCTIYLQIQVLFVALFPEQLMPKQPTICLFACISGPTDLIMLLFVCKTFYQYSS